MFEPSSKWFLNCCCKVNVIFKVTKNGIYFKDLCYKLLRIFTCECINILRMVLIRVHVKNCYSALLLLLRKPVFKQFQSGLTRMQALGLTLCLRPEGKKERKGGHL
jgi:hypothetical protein